MPRPPDISPESPAGPTGPADRYGRPGAGEQGRRRRRFVVAVAVLLALGVAYAVWFGVASRDRAVARTQGYDVIDDTSTEVTFTVSMPAGSVADCQVEALSSGSAQVGLVTVPVGPSDETAVTVRAVLVTSERATTGQPVACTLR